MTRILTSVLSVAVLAGVAGCGAAKPVKAAASTPNAVAAEAKRTALITTAEGYTNALLTGDAAGLTGYLGRFCSKAEQGQAIQAASLTKQSANGATTKVTDVLIDGDRGSASRYELSASAPQELRQAFNAGMSAPASYPFRWVDGRWYFKGECTGVETAPPTPAA